MANISKKLKILLGEKKFCSAVILAAGTGSRFSSDIKKQFIKINNKSILLTTALVFQNSEIIDEIIVVTNPEHVEHTLNNLKENGITKLTKVVPGGDTRLISSRIGVEAVNPDSEYIAIHDAARCLITKEIIDKTFETAFIYGASSAASKVTDTIKITDNNGFIKDTVPRDNLWSVQTPQVFKANLIRAAHYYAQKDSFFGTDDCSLCENINYKVKLVDTGKLNMKITYPEDFLIAETILKNNTNKEE